MKKIIVLSLCVALSSVGLAAAQTAGAPGNAEAPQDRAAMRAERKAAFLAEADTNKDGTFSPEERKAARTARAKARFERKDANGDGRLSPSELPRMPGARFAKLDGNGDGQLTTDEFKPRNGKRAGKGMMGRRFFDRVDADNDGKITQAEMHAAADAHFKRIDVNGDGSVTREEAKNARRSGKDKIGSQTKKLKRSQKAAKR